jgi:hypothetical protein
MREQLIRYLLGELDADERRELRAQLRENPDLQRELEHLRECFAANQDDDSVPPPPGRLAERTALRAANSDEFDLEAMKAGAMSSAGDPCSGVLGWSLADLSVAAGVMLALSMLVFPALRDSRDGTRRNVCQNNQYQLWALVTRYAQDHGGFYPQVRPNETAGVFAVRLIEKGYVPKEELAALLICPASPVADQIRAGEFTIRLLSPEEIRQVSPVDLKHYTSSSSPSFAYALPAKVGDGYLYPQSGPKGHSAFDPLLGDISNDPLNPMKPHHRGDVIQFINGGGCLRTVVPHSQTVFDGDLDIYHNDLDLVSAGLRPHDVVLGASDAMTALEFAPHERLPDH